jgi:adenylate cyclase
MEHPIVYIPMDRRQALAGRQTLPDRTYGAALFADISGFTPLTEALVQELGPQRGAEELTRYLNLVYDAVIDELHRYGGSVIAFAGDAITCWLAGDNGLRATAAALAMQAALRAFHAIHTPAGSTVELAMKAAVATGPARRFVVGDPALRFIDALAGETLVRLAGAEHLAQRGEVVIDGVSLPRLGSAVAVGAIRQDQQTGREIAVVTGLNQPVAATPWPTLPLDAVPEEQIRNWLLAPVYERLCSGLGNFLAELRPTVALFVRFGGIDYDNDDEAGAKLDAYIRWLQAIIERYEGTLVDLNIGDKGSYLYINFGAPLSHEDNADRAAATALALRNQPAELDFLEPVQIGISQGRMRAGAYGGANHRTYGVLGDAVNLAARLMMAAQPGQILVSEEAQRSLSGRFALEQLPPIRVKGKGQPVTLFALTEMRQAAGFHLKAPDYGLPMVGRQAELALARQKLALAAGGVGQVVGVTGEAGLGKSRLVAEIIAAAGERQFTLYGGECESYGINSSYLVWQPIWRAFFGLDGAWPHERQVEHLQSRLESINPTFPARLPLLDVVLNLELPDNDLTQTLDARLRKELLQALLVDCLRSEARHTPFLFVLEACQWLDPLSLELLETIGKAIVDLPVLLLVAFRPLERQRLELTAVRSLLHYSELELRPLTATEAGRLVQLKLAQVAGEEAKVPASLVERLATQAEGNPFYLEELITYLHLRRIDFADARALETVELPDSLQRLVLTLVDQLSESEKITVKVASVLGRVFRAAWLHGAYPELADPTRIQNDLESLRHQELMNLEPAEPELVYLFRQVITQGVTYESLPFSVRAILHEQIGLFIEQSYADTINHYLDLLAHHYDRSTNQEKQRHYLLKAGEAAQANYANVSAIDYFQRLLHALEPEQQGPILLKLGQVFDTVGHYEEADNSLRAALALAERQGDSLLQIQCQIALGELRRKQSRYEEAAHSFAWAQTAAEQAGDPAGVAKALICAGSLYLYQGDTARAQECYTQSLAIRRQLDDLPNISNVLNNTAITAAIQGDFSSARTLFEESLAIRRQLHDRWGVTNSLNNLGQLALDLEAYDDARAYLEEAVTGLREIGDRWSLGNALVTLGNAVRGQQDYPAAYPLYQESLQIYRTLGDRRMLSYLLENIGALLALQGDGERALQLVGAAAALRSALGTPLSTAEQAQLDEVLDPVRQTLGAAAASAWTTGHALALDAAINLALDARPTPLVET